MKALMKNKWALGLILVGLAAAIYFIYKKATTKAFNNIGDSRYLPTEYNDNRLALEMANSNHGIKAGDNIEINHNSDVVPKGKAQVLEVVEKNGLPFVVTSLKLWGENPDISGNVKVV